MAAVGQRGISDQTTYIVHPCYIDHNKPTALLFSTRLVQWSNVQKHRVVIVIFSFALMQSEGSLVDLRSTPLVGSII